MSVFIGYPSFMAYQMMKGKKGNNDGFPSIPGMIARYSALGLTNEQMATNPVWVDKTGNGHDLQMKNFAWGGMSGVGGYKYNFLSNDWLVDGNQSSVALSHKIVIINKRTSIQFIKLIRNELENTINITLKITGLEANDSSFKIYDNVGSSHAQRYNKDGIYQINYTATEGANRIYFYMPGGNMGQLENPITVEQLPLYPGALVFDGVDDYGVCDNFPILTKEKGYTVVALRQWITYNPNAISAIATNASDRSFNGAFTFENYNKGADQTISYGATQISLQYSKSPFSWQTTSKYNGFNIANGNKDATNSLVLGRSYPQRNDFANFASWELVFLDHDATEEELTKIKDYFVKTYPWLFPDQAWTVTGKTNEDKDRATIANITGNGNDLILSNFGFIEGSGYNEESEYAGYLVTDGVDDKAVSKQFKFGKNFTVILDFKFPVKKISYCGFDLSSKVRILNLQGSGVYVVLKGNKTLIPSNVVRAVTSEGKVYDENWNEYNIVPGNISSNYTMVNSMVNLGFDGSNQFAESATKFVGIYSSTLSKDDCIKAYNYLQTLKAK